MRSITRTLYFSLFTLIEYVRSWRILVEFLATGIFFYGFFVQHWGSAERDGELFFNLTCIFLMLLTFYTTSSVLSLADRPQGYLVLSRRIGKTGYLLGVYLAGMNILSTLYGLIMIAATVVGDKHGAHRFDLNQWFLAAPPLLLNVALLMAFLFLISPFVLASGWRLFLLFLIALALSGNFISGPVREKLSPLMRNLLSSAQTLLSWPLVPILSGFSLTLNSEHGFHAIVILIAQCSLLVSILGFALYLFSKRELLLSED